MSDSFSYTVFYRKRYEKFNFWPIYHIMYTDYDSWQMILFVFMVRFSCELGLENRQYVMRKVYPAVADVDRLVESLNKNNDISGFVIVLRKRFLTTV